MLLAERSCRVVRSLAQPRETGRANQQPVVRESDSHRQGKEEDRQGGGGEGRGGERKNRGEKEEGPHKSLDSVSLMASEVLATPHCKALR